MLPPEHGRTADSHAFDQATIAAMAKAYEIGCLTIKGRADSDKDRLARLIIEIAKDGERDPVQLCAKAVNRITSPQLACLSWRPSFLPTSTTVNRLRRSGGFQGVLAAAQGKVTGLAVSWSVGRF